MVSLRKTRDRGHFNHGWLDTCHTFSFADYHGPAQMGFPVLRVINEYVVAPGRTAYLHRQPLMGKRSRRETGHASAT